MKRPASKTPNANSPVAAPWKMYPGYIGRLNHQQLLIAIEYRILFGKSVICPASLR